VLAYTGARISEALAVCPSRVDFSAQLIVLESLKKRRRGVFRAVPVPDEVLAEIDRVHVIRARQNSVQMSARLWPWCRTTAWSHIKRCMALACLPASRATPKALRHGFAVAALQTGVPINIVKRWLGH